MEKKWAVGVENKWVGVENGLLGAEKGGEGQLELKMGSWVQKWAVGCKNGSWVLKMDSWCGKQVGWGRKRAIGC